MRQGICLLDRALNIAHQEMAAIEAGEYDKAGELARQRGDIISQAWSLLGDESAEQYRSRLVSLAQMQRCLTSMAAGTRDVVVESLQKSRQGKKRMRGYRQSLGHVLQ
ncbi:MAG: hypothetical protein ZNDK_0546 [Candidatus Desulfovibrio kirbyi]|uniref:Uncharacterized protein n=1 Tax=Candidatus Desulfovibrio kirbyi TaxID=2696086 RepID=A0A6L2R5H6_9BACT|nr:MAG: hypothetical protein ZNDK_0546 [Candidatus Desulfovibrio kirbyi]